MSREPEQRSANDNPGNSESPAEPSRPSREPELPRWATRGSQGAVSDARFAAYIGKKWTTTYARKLAKFRDDPAFVPTWNWAAAVFPSLWFLYRKLYLAFALSYILPGIALWLLLGSDAQVTVQSLTLPENRPLLIMNLAITLSQSIAAGGTANWLLFRRARAASTIVDLQHLPEDASLALLNRIGGVNRTPTILMVLCFAVMSLAAALATTATK